MTVKREAPRKPVEGGSFVDGKKVEGTDEAPRVPPKEKKAKGVKNG